MNRFSDYVRCDGLAGHSVLYFPKQHAAKVKRRNKLVTEIMDLRDQGRDQEASLLIGKMVRLNRSIPKCGISESEYFKNTA